jgi:hypothetical protein
LIYKVVIATYIVDGIYSTERSIVEIESKLPSADEKGAFHPTKKRINKPASENRRTLRQALWPDVTEDELWLRSQRVGFTTIPRTMSLICQILDRLSGKGFPLSSTYLALWCWVFDEGIVEVRSPREMAIESGFNGPRAETTWRGRMRRLEDLGFIKSAAGLSSDFQYVLLLNPLRRIKEIYSKQPRDLLYVGLLGRYAQVGANDFEFSLAATDLGVSPTTAR